MQPDESLAGDRYWYELLKQEKEKFVDEVSTALGIHMGRDKTTSNCSLILQGKEGTAKMYSLNVLRERGAESKRHATLVCATVEKVALLYEPDRKLHRLFEMA